jgi:hypothetical protein
LSASPRAISEKKDTIDLLKENKEEIKPLEGLYDNRKEFLDQHKLTEDTE